MQHNGNGHNGHHSAALRGVPFSPAPPIGGAGGEGHRGATIGLSDGGREPRKEHAIPGVPEVSDERVFRAHPVGFQLSDPQGVGKVEGAVDIVAQNLSPSGEPRDFLGLRLFYHQARGSSQRSANLRDALFGHMKGKTDANKPLIEKIDGSLAGNARRAEELAKQIADKEAAAGKALGASGVLLVPVLEIKEVFAAVERRKQDITVSAGVKGVVPVSGSRLPEPVRKIGEGIYDALLSVGLSAFMVWTFGSVLKLFKAKNLTSPYAHLRAEAWSGLYAALIGTVATELLAARFARDVGALGALHTDAPPVSGGRFLASPAHRAAVGICASLAATFLFVSCLEAVGLRMLATNSLKKPPSWAVCWFTSATLSAIAIFPRAARSYRRGREAARHAVLAADVYRSREDILGNAKVGEAVAALHERDAAKRELEQLRLQREKLLAERERLLNPKPEPTLARALHSADREARLAMAALLAFVASLPGKIAAPFGTPATTASSRPGFWGRLWGRITDFFARFKRRAPRE